jgi:hypothetical protein
VAVKLANVVLRMDIAEELKLIVDKAVNPALV